MDPKTVTYCPIGKQTDGEVFPDTRSEFTTCNKCLFFPRSITIVEDVFYVMKMNDFFPEFGIGKSQINAKGFDLKTIFVNAPLSGNTVFFVKIRK
jgi:hypothetical protein